MASRVEELEKTWELCQRIDFSAGSANLESGLLEPILCLLGAEMAVFRVFTWDNPKPTFLTGLGIQNTVHDAYLNRYFRLDPIRDLLAHRFGGPLFADQRKEGRWEDGCANMKGQRRASTASMIAAYEVNFRQFRTEFLSPYNLRHHLGFCFQDPEGSHTFLLNFVRGRSSRAFDRLEHARARIVGTLLHARAAQFNPGTFNHNGCADAVRLHREASTDLSCETNASDRQLSARELEVAEAVAMGLTNKEVGAALGISVRTVENHMRSIFAKLAISTRTRLAAKLLALRSRSALTRPTST